MHTLFSITKIRDSRAHTMSSDERKGTKKAYKLIIINERGYQIRITDQAAERAGFSVAVPVTIFFARFWVI